MSRPHLSPICMTGLLKTGRLQWGGGEKDGGRGEQKERGNVGYGWLCWWWNMDHHRGIALMSIPCKVFSPVLLNRMKDTVDPELWDQQASYCRGRSTTDQTATLRVKLEQSCEWNSFMLTLLIMSKHLRVWTSRASGNCWDTMAYQSRSPASLETPTGQWHAEWSVVTIWQMPFK